MERFPPKHVVVAADLSAPSFSALDAAKTLARRWGSSLEVVHVQYEPLAAAAASMEGMSLPMVPPSPAVEERLRRDLRRAVGAFPEDRLSVRSIPGWPPHELAELAAPARSEMLVIGTHGYAGLDRLTFGSVAEAVVRRARVPVLAVHERRSPVRVARILAPWREQPYATRALRYARELAGSLGAELHVLNVAESGRNSDARTRALRRRLEEVLGSGPGWTLRVRSGDPREQILKEAGSGRYGILVLSAHRRRFLGDLVLGSTVERVLRHSRVPVLAVPSGAVSRRPLVTRPVTWAAGKVFSA